MPANTNQLFPLPTGDNVALPNLSFAQFLSHYVGVTVGKFDTMTGDVNEFAHGKGDTQFFNLAFNINPVALCGAVLDAGRGSDRLADQRPQRGHRHASSFSRQPGRPAPPASTI